MKNEDELIRELFAYVGRVKGSTPSGAYMAIFLAGVTMPLWKRYMGDYQALIDFVNANKDKCDRAEPKASPAASIRVLDLGPEVFSFASIDDWKERARDLYAEVYRKGHLQDELMEGEIVELASIDETSSMRLLPDVVKLRRKLEALR